MASSPESPKSPESDSGVARFEAALAELEQIVGKLERGELKLEESLKLFERGVVLTKACRESLDSAELKVQQLLGDGPASS
ncbi:MAG TPA: exodeoxyribonuclease VII small subunit [Verrucomicrobiae bacterium]|nr:exodeoxyribonuclease VII small subunit [Verrucomicrobiae bacterium]